MIRVHLALCAMIALMASACDSGTTQVGAGGGSGDTSSSGSGEVVMDIPCELDALLKERCRTCHSDPPIAGAVRSMTSHSDLVGSGDGHDSLAEASITRMELESMDEERMPPAPRALATDDEVAIFRDFVNDGFPMRAEGETCE